MAGTDRAWDHQRDASDSASDAPRPESTVPSAGRGHFLTDARTRQECALAYRATVDAVYAKAVLYAAAPRWFNAVNHEGTVLAVDGQAALFEEWPPSKDGLGFDENGMSYSDAVYFTADGKVARNDHQ